MKVEIIFFQTAVFRQFGNFLYRNIAKGHPELVSGSHREPILMLHRGQMLKQVQHDYLLWVIVFYYIDVCTRRLSIVRYL